MRIQQAGLPFLFVACFFIGVPAFAATDTTAPTVGLVNPLTVVAGQSVALNANYSDSGSGVIQCTLIEGGSTLWTSAVFSSTADGNASVMYSFPTAGTHYLQMQCRDAAGNWGYGPMLMLTVTAAATDRTPPTVGDVFANVDQPQSGVPITYYVNATDAIGVTQCHLLLDSTDVGGMMLGNNGSYAILYSWPPASTDVVHSAQARCSDAAGNIGMSQGVKYVHVIPTLLVASPTLSTLMVRSDFATADGSQTITVIVTAIDAAHVAVVGKRVTVTSSQPGTVVISDPVVTNQAGQSIFTAKSPVAGAYGVIAYIDGVMVYEQPTIHFVAPSCPFPVGMVKLQDDANPATTADQAVYYYGTDCKRHAFPNEKVFYSWTGDFTGVRIISASQMSNMPLGSNVTYRPGIKLVKFQTLNRVYAVARGGVLRWVTTEAIASLLYGSNWNQKVDDIPDVFYGNYSFGADVQSASEYNSVNEMANAPTIDASR